MARNKTFLIVAALLLIVMLSIVGCGGGRVSEPQESTNSEPSGSQGKSTTHQVTLQLNWLPSEYPVEFVALEKGFWAEQNLEVKIVRGYGSGDTITKIAAKQAEFGLADLGNLILAEAKENIRVKAVANYYTYHPAGVLYRADSHIKEPKDLEGKSIVTTANSAYAAFWPVFAQAVGIDESKVRLELVDPSLQQPTFVNGQVDAWLSDNQSIPIMDKIGIEAKLFSFKFDGGIDRYGDSIIVHEDLIAENPDLIRRFVAGFLKGVQYSIENPEEAVQIWKKHVAEIDAEMAIKTWQGDIENEVMLSDEALEKGLGWMSEEKMLKSIDTVVKAYNLQSTIAPEEVYTTEFLPRDPIYPPQSKEKN